MATALSGLLVRHYREALIDGTGESAELQFNIPRGLAISIEAITGRLNLGDLDGAAITVDLLLSLDGPALSSNALSTQALYEAHEVLDSVIFAMNGKNDNVTTGGTLQAMHEHFQLPEPILTARNLGAAGLSIGASGEIFIDIYFKWVQVSIQEFIRLIADLRT